MTDSKELQFSEKYDQKQSKAYLEKHQAGFWRMASNQREVTIARKALAIAGNPASILDLPCGAGRFWPMLVSTGAKELIAADYSPNMIDIAVSNQPPEIVSHFRTLQTSAFSIDLPDNAVDSVLCMRLIHHVGESDDRLRLLKELHRVARETVCISLWVDGNYQAYRRKKLEARRKKKSYQNRFVIPAAEIEREFSTTGFRIKGQVNLIKYLSMWRIYVLSK